MKEGLLLIEPNKELVGSISQELQTVVYGQKEACDSVAKALIRFSSGMRDPKLPVGAFFELGGTGTGKTEMARAVAKLWFGDPESDRLRILNMGEYEDKGSTRRIVGSPPSYVGYDEEGAIPHSWLNQESRSIIVIDEAEKAHPAVMNLWLSALEEGKINARSGIEGFQDLRFNNTLFIFTSNVGAEHIDNFSSRRRLGFKTDTTNHFKEAKADALLAMRQHFKPEFLGRMTDTIVFKPLGVEVFGQVLEKFTERFNKENRNLVAPTVRLDESAKEYLVSLSRHDARYGARAIRAVFTNHVINGISELYMSGCIEGDDQVVIFADNNELKFYKQAYKENTWSE